VTVPAVADLAPRGAPECSVVVPVYGGEAFIATTLGALAEHTEGRLEVIVVDNASPDRAMSVVEQTTRGAMIVRNERNLGFGAACNQGAARASAPLLCFLNSDAVVTEGWLDGLRRAIDADRGTVAAVPRYVEADGTVQEAGAVLTADGTGLLLGFGALPDDASHRFPRVVEYGSAACLVVRRAEFLAAGGFDPAFGLAYGEDADLALRLGAAGRRVRYAPEAVVVHARGASGGHRLDALRARNAALAAARWADVLADRPPVDDLVWHPERLVALRDAVCPERMMLALDHVPPQPHPLDGLVGELARRWPSHRCTVLTIHPPGPERERWLGLGAEVADGHDDWYGWARSRVGHATVAWTVGAGAAARFGRLLAVTQPQATRVHTPDDAAGPWLAVAGAPWPEPALAHLLGTEGARDDERAAAQADLVLAGTPGALDELAGACGFGSPAQPAIAQEVA
jgi:GT2 family glycosyltransferase